MGRGQVGEVAGLRAVEVVIAMEAAGDEVEDLAGIREAERELEPDGEGGLEGEGIAKAAVVGFEQEFGGDASFFFGMDAKAVLPKVEWCQGAVELDRE
jgi:hypothetical protein